MNELRNETKKQKKTAATALEAKRVVMAVSSDDGTVQKKVVFDMEDEHVRNQFGRQVH